jgi:ankyrin repeat protein
MGEIITRIDRLLASGFDINVGHHENTHNALEAALRHPRPKWLAEFLLDRGADPNRRNHLNQTPLHTIAYRCSKRLLHVCIDRGADVNALDSKHNTPLFTAADNRWPEGMWILLTRGARESHVNSQGFTILHSTCEHSFLSLECLKAVIQWGTVMDKSPTRSGVVRLDKNAKTPNGNTVLHMAVSCGERDAEDHLEAVVLLTRYGVDLTAKNNEGLTAQHIASIFLGESLNVGNVHSKLDSPDFDVDSMRAIHDFLQNELLKKREALLMALHHRLGEKSDISCLDVECLRNILNDAGL